MKSKVLIALVAVVLGAFAAIASFIYLSGVQRAVQAGSAMVEVLVAKQEIPRGTPAEDLLGSGAVELTRMPLRYVPEGAISSVTSVSDRVLAVATTKGEVLTASRFQYPSDAGLSFNVPDGYVAVTVPVDDARGVAGLVKPGDRVAVMVSVARPDNESQTGYAVLGAKVLAVGQSTGAESKSDTQQSSGGAFGSSGSQSGANKTVTVAVSAADAEKVVFGAEAGRLWLALLPTTASAASTSTPITAATVLK